MTSWFTKQRWVASAVLSFVEYKTAVNIAISWNNWKICIVHQCAGMPERNQMVLTLNFWHVHKSSEQCKYLENMSIGLPKRIEILVKEWFWPMHLFCISFITQKVLFLEIKTTYYLEPLTCSGRMHHFFLYYENLQFIVIFLLVTKFCQ